MKTNISSRTLVNLEKIRFRFNTSPGPYSRCDLQIYTHSNTKCRISGLTVEPVNQNLHFHFHQIPGHPQHFWVGRWSIKSYYLQRQSTKNVYLWIKWKLPNVWWYSHANGHASHVETYMLSYSCICTRDSWVNNAYLVEITSLIPWWWWYHWWNRPQPLTKL